MFKSTIKTSIIALATASMMTAASANDVFEIVNNTQENLTDVISDVNLDLGTVGKQAKIESGAYGNDFALQVEEVGVVDVNTNQRSRTDNIFSIVNIQVDKTPILDIDSEALGNKAVVVNRNHTGGNIINNTQEAGEALPPPPPPAAPPAAARGCGCGDPLSDVDIVAGELDDLKLNSTAGGNLGQFILGGNGNTINSLQETDVMNNSLVDIEVGNITNELNVNSRAFGNSLVVVLGNVPEAPPAPDTSGN